MRFELAIQALADAGVNNGTIFTLSTTAGAINLLADVAGLGSFDQVKAPSSLLEATDE